MTSAAVDEKPNGEVVRVVMLGVLRVDRANERAELVGDVGGLVEVADLAGTPVLHLEVEVAPAQFQGVQLVAQPPGVRLEQRPLLAGRLIAATRAGQVGPHVFDAQADRAQVAQRLERRDIVGAVAAVAARVVPLDRAHQADPLPVPQGALGQPAPGDRLGDRERSRRS